MPKSTIAFAAVLSLMTGGAAAQPSGWSTGYQMGTAYAGVSGASGARLTFYCGEAAAARANPAIQGGPYLMAALPNDQLKGVAPATIEVVADGKAMPIPVAAKPDGEQIEFTWKPERGFGLPQMRSVVAALRKAKRIELRAAGSTFAISAEGAAKALAEDPLRC
ncbi:hypothetical protein [Bosea sp. BK604]|uniref:hypothetical protein n=1 Tax=Bosea sp. BK604 TaxID=2512180 RepID=UPI00104709F2|nr:hypothetical protein [Bosea sp. BK604]TCR69747.1 hypothetical protein EV560_101145 [Bosea sp. BK604]